MVLAVLTCSAGLLRAQSAILDAGPPVPSQAIGNGNAYIEPGETWNLTVPLTNVGGADATAINSVLTSSTPGVTIVSGSSAYPDLTPTATGSNVTPYSFSVDGAAPCGARIDFTLSVTFTAGSSPQSADFVFSLGTGSPGTPITFSYTGPAVPIPDGNDPSPGAPAAASLPVAAIAGNVFDVDVSIDGTLCDPLAGSPTVGIDHTFINDLELTLISPAGTQVLVVDNTDGSGNNFCQTVLDDESGGPSIQSVLTAQAPFTGSFTPNAALSAFDGENGNGTWQLQAQDFFTQDTGNIRAFSVTVTPAVCDFQGQLPAVVTATKTVTGAPVPGGNIVYTVVLTNSGSGPQNDNPGDELTDVLPASLILASATATSGTPVATVGTNTVTWNGGIPIGGSVTITITATVTLAITSCNDTPGGGPISNQGFCAYDSDGNNTNDATCVTDDPTTPTPGDPTVLPVASAVCEIPTLSDLGLAVLCLALAGAALLLLRRRGAAG